VVKDAPDADLANSTPRNEVRALAADLEDPRKLPRVAHVEILQDAHRQHNLIGGLAAVVDGSGERCSCGKVVSLGNVVAFNFEPALPTREEWLKMNQRG
jgi:hypothetical protein